MWVRFTDDSDRTLTATIVGGNDPYRLEGDTKLVDEVRYLLSQPDVLVLQPNWYVEINDDLPRSLLAVTMSLGLEADITTLTTDEISTLEWLQRGGWDEDELIGDEVF